MAVTDYDAPRRPVAELDNDSIEGAVRTPGNPPVAHVRELRDRALDRRPRGPPVSGCLSWSKTWSQGLTWMIGDRDDHCSWWSDCFTVC